MSVSVKLILTLVIGYLLGSISTGVIISRVFGHKDIRSEGSGNSGTTNMLRVMGKKYALLTFVGDLLKGIVAVLIGKAWLGTQAGEIVGAFGAILGHNFPLRFQGRKGHRDELRLSADRVPGADAVRLRRVSADRGADALCLRRFAGRGRHASVLHHAHHALQPGHLGFGDRHLPVGDLAACAEHQAPDEPHGKQNQPEQKEIIAQSNISQSQKERVRKTRSFFPL